METPRVWMTPRAWVAKSCKSETPPLPFILTSLKCQFCSPRCQLSWCCYHHHPPAPENIWSFPTWRTCLSTILAYHSAILHLIPSHASPHSSCKPILTHIQAPALSFSSCVITQPWSHWCKLARVKYSQDSARLKTVSHANTSLHKLQ